MKSSELCYGAYVMIGVQELQSTQIIEIKGDFIMSIPGMSKKKRFIIIILSFVCGFLSVIIAIIGWTIWDIARMELAASKYNRAPETSKVFTDIDYVQERFPDLEEIEDVTYYYNLTDSNVRLPGPSNVEFCGFIKIGEDFCEKITQEYSWKETKKSKKLVPKEVLTKGEDQVYHFLYNEDFSEDHISASWVGDFYLDPTKRMLYFECER